VSAKFTTVHPVVGNAGEILNATFGGFLNLLSLIILERREK
jgi:hypothetical protein